jgi:hypothetical protein
VAALADGQDHAMEKEETIMTVDQGMVIIGLLSWIGSMITVIMAFVIMIHGKVGR